jgi:hypothetical protein
MQNARRLLFLTRNSYIQFHPLAYLVKLNIEMTMANLIKRIAISTSRKTGNANLAQDFASSNFSTTGQKSGSRMNARRNSLIELRSHTSASKGSPQQQGNSIMFAANEIRVTEDFHVVSEPLPHYTRDDEYGRSDMEINDPDRKEGDGTVVKSRSLDDVTEGESVKSGGQGNGDSDDESALVARRNHGGWGRLRG